MLAPFFAAAACSPSRQSAFRRLVVTHLFVLLAATYALLTQSPGKGASLIGHILLVAGIVAGALVVGWRLVQLPRSQALEFVLVSPLRPFRFFLAESSVGLALLALLTLSGLPILLFLVADGRLDPLDPVALLIVPWTWGAITGLGLTAWAYEPRSIRRWGERLGLALVLFYLVVGVLAGENLRRWVDFLPGESKFYFLHAFQRFHTDNPFGLLRAWLNGDIGHVWQTAIVLQIGSLVGLTLLLVRAACRLEGHFHERHYGAVRDVSGQRRPAVGDQPLSWWAVKRVSEYSGRINLYLAGGFCLVYAFYVVAGEHWPAWMGRSIFHLCDTAGGPAAIAAALVVLAAVPAAFQYGLWDHTVQDRCRRLELLLLTHLRPRDYWDAAAAAAWSRGRGYFAAAALLWVGALLGGRLAWTQLLTVVSAAVLLWSLYFALGFGAFARGEQANGLGLLLTVGLPLAALALGWLGWGMTADWLPPGMVYRAATPAPSLAWLVGPITGAGLTLWVARRALARCDAQLRRWYDENCGRKVVN